MSKENFQIHENSSNKTKEIFKNLVSLILPENLTFEEQIESLKEQRQKKIKNIVNSSDEQKVIDEADKIIKEKLKKAA